MKLNFAITWNDSGGELIWSNERQMWILTETDHSPVFTLLRSELEALEAVIKAAEQEHDLALRLTK